MSNQDRERTQAYRVVIPQLGLTMQEATITEWLHGDGDWVEKGAPLFILENEKSTVEVEAPASGKLRIQIGPGETVPVLHAVGLIEGAGRVADHHIAEDTHDAAQNLAERPMTGDRKPVSRFPSSVKVIASPRARAAARQRGIDLRSLSGSGIRGMITVSDLPQSTDRVGEVVLASPVARNLARSERVDLEEVQGSGPRGRIMREDVEKHLDTRAAQPGEDLLSGLGGLRGIIARRLSQSWQERPQVTLTTDVVATGLVGLRNQINAQLAEDQQAKGVLKISYNALLMKLAALCMKEYPYMNASLTEEGMVLHQAVNIGVAVDTARGLLVPVIKDVDKKSLVTLQSEFHALAQRAQDGKSTPDDLTGGTFTITNLGAYGVDAFTPIINPPESAVLGVGRILPRPVGVAGDILLRETVVLSLSFDHRLIDGAPAASFLKRLSVYIETPPDIGELLREGGNNGVAG